MLEKIENFFATHKEEAYAAFQRKLIPTVEPERVLGIRIPKLRKLAQSLTEEESAAFMAALPHRYYDEDILHALLFSYIKDREKSLKLLENFLPYVDNWAVCDTIRLPWVRKEPAHLLPYIDSWLESEREYTVRCAVFLLLCYYLDDQFTPLYPQKLSRIHRKEYYINMVLAWYYATALAKQWETVFPYLEENRLDIRVHNKTIQKARESQRISKEQKQLLATLYRSDKD